VEAFQNSEALPRVFGSWPSFHDSEVIAIRLRREGQDAPLLEADIHVFEVTNETDERGYSICTNHTLVTLLFTYIEELEVEEFNKQNVLFDLCVERTAVPHAPLLVEFESSHGVGVRLRCAECWVLRAEPYEPPPGSIYHRARKC